MNFTGAVSQSREWRAMKAAPMTAATVTEASPRNGS
jgi:hypothetical protein